MLGRGVTQMTRGVRKLPGLGWSVMSRAGTGTGLARARARRGRRGARPSRPGAGVGHGQGGCLVMIGEDVRSF